ncbi:MAG: ribokinase [Rhodoluna sp.]
MSKGKIAVVGAMNMDLAVSTKDLPKKGESVLGSSILQSAGGKGANQAVAAALVGGNVVLISMRGNDAYGEQLVAAAQKSGVDTTLIEVSGDTATGTAVIAVDSHGDNMIVISPGANALITPEIASENLLKDGNLSVVSICGELALPAIKSALETAQEIGATSVLNLSPYNPAAIALLPLTNVLVVNQHEAADITGVADPRADWPATIAGFKKVGSRDVVVTLGEEGAMILDCVNSAEPIKVDAIKVTAVDTTGCGDAFTGSLCVELAAGASMVDAAKFAVKAAGYAAKSAGAQISYGTREQVLNVN